MILDTILGETQKILLDKGKDALHNQYPRDFEVYMCALELVDDRNNSVDYFAFPVMPKSITKTETEATTIQTSFSGITVFNKSGFIPKELTLQGDFGRSFKFMGSYSGKTTQSVGYAKALNFYSMDFGFYTADSVNSNIGQIIRGFPFGVKTGYGCSKILQSIIDKAKSHGATGKTYKLFFYNPALGENYLVVPTKNPLTWSQNEQSNNMIWQYTLSLTIIANMADVLDYTPTNKQLNYTFNANKIANSLKSTLSTVLNYIKV